MRVWKLEFTAEAEKEHRKLPKAIRIQVDKSLHKVLQNPLPQSEGGYGKPLGGNLAGCLKIKLKKSGIRIVYKLVRVDDVMKIIVVAARADNEVYEIAEKRVVI
jgi:mRNA interferase RelE/StbE